MGFACRVTSNYVRVWFLGKQLTPMISRGFARFKELCETPASTCKSSDINEPSLSNHRWIEIFSWWTL